MSWSILLFPLLGGYYYLTRCIRTKHKYRRLERQRLIFNSSISGFAFLLLSFLICSLLKWAAPNLANHLTLVPIKIDYFYTSLLGFIFAVCWTEGFNGIKKKLNPNIENWYLAKAILKTGNSMQKDLLNSYLNSELLMITLRNGKVYIGIATELNEPDGQSYVRILPFYSGYRKENFDVELITDYLSVYKELENGDLSESINTETVLCEYDIITTTFFRQKVYNRFNDENKPPPKKEN